MRSPRTLAPSVLVGFVGVAIVIVGTLLVGFITVRSVAQATTWVAHTSDVKYALNHLLLMAEDAETGQRGFVITGTDDYLEPYDRARRAVASDLTRISELTTDNPAQQADVTRLSAALDSKLQELAESIRLRRDSGFEAARALVSSDAGKRTMDQIRAIVAGMESREDVLMTARAAGTARSYQIAAIARLTAAVVSLLAVGALFVVTRRYVAERLQAARSAEQLAVTLRSIGDAVIATDDRGHVTHLNRVAEELTGWRETSAIGKPLDEVFVIINEDSRQRVETPVRRVLAEGRIVGLANHTVLVAKDGSERPIDDSAAPIRGAGGVVGCVLIFRDVTERRATEGRLHQLIGELSNADQRKNEFLAVLAHELRNPLAPIGNAIELVRIAASRDRTLEPVAAVLQRQLTHLVHLVDDLLDVSRISRGTIELRRAAIELAAPISHAIEAFRPKFDARRVALHVSLPPDPIYVDADSTRISQIVGNLLSNAAKFTPPGGQVWLSLASEHGMAVIRVRDSGIGIAREALPHVFEMFMQVEPTSERQGGLGIGLALSRSLVEQHNGSIEAVSEGLGLGTEFVVRLPALRDRPVETTGLPAAAAPSPPARRVLVVDDNHDSADSLAALLKLQGHDVLVGHDGLSALESASAFQPEVVLLDIGLPLLNGYDAARQIRALPSGKDILLVAVTGWGQDADRQRSADAGFDEHFVKPVDLHAITKLIASHREPDPDPPPGQ